MNNKGSWLMSYKADPILTDNGSPFKVSKKEKRRQIMLSRKPHILAIYSSGISHAAVGKKVPFIVLIISKFQKTKDDIL